MATDATSKVDATSLQLQTATVSLESLNTLRESNRLAIHGWEERLEFGGESHLAFPVRTSQSLYDAPQDVDSALHEHVHNDSPLKALSLSLMPSRRSPKTMCPYGAYANDRPAVSYLIDLSSQQSLPSGEASGPVVIKANEEDLSSGWEAENKDYQFQWISKVPALRAFYEQFDSEESFLRVLAESEQRSLSEEPLDLLANAYLDQMIDFRREDHNEVIAVCALSHVRAIMVPVFDRSSDFSPSEVKVGRALERFEGALAGLQHINQGYDFPVVAYQVNGKDAGEMSMMGEGKESLSAILVSSFAELNRSRANLSPFLGGSRDCYLRAANSEATKVLLGADVLKEGDDLQTALSRLSRGVRSRD